MTDEPRNETPTEGTEEVAAASRRPRGLRAATVAAWAVFVLVTVFLLFVVFLQTDMGLGFARGIAVGQIQELLTEDATISIEAVGGNFLTGARMYGLEIEQHGEVVIRVDTAKVRYTLFTLMRSRFSARDAYLGGLHVRMRELEDGRYNMQTLFKPADTTHVEESRFVVQVADLEVARGIVDVHFFAPGADSILSIQPINLKLSDFETGPEGTKLSLDTLATNLYAPHNRGEAAVAMAGALTPDAVVIDTLRFVSPVSDVAVKGEWLFASDEHRQRYNFDVITKPLAFSDIRAFVGTQLYGDLHMTAAVRTVRNELNFDVNARLDDATAVFTGALSLDDSGPVRYRAEGQVRSLDPGRVLGNPALAADLNANLQVNFAGASPQQLDGPFELVLTRSRFGDQVINRLDLDGRFRAGRLAFNLNGDLPGARLAAEGTARPFDDLPRYDVRGRVQEFNLASFTGDPDQRTRVAGTFSLEGQGLDPETMVLRASADLSQAAYGDFTLAGLRFDAHLRRQLLDFDGRAALPSGGGVVVARGQARPFEDVLTVTVDQGRLEQVNLAVLTNDPDQQSRLTGGFSLTMVGTEPEQMRLDFSTQLRNSAYGDFQVAALDLEGRLDSGLLAFDGAADLAAAGNIQATGAMRPFADVISYEVAGRADRFDLSYFSDDPTAASSDLTGTFSVTGRGFDPETMALAGNVVLAGSRYDDFSVDAADLTFSLQARDLNLSGDVRAEAGQVTLVSSMRLFEEPFRINLHQGTRFANLNLGILTDNPSLDTNLAGAIVGTFVGTDLATMFAEGNLVLDAGRINQQDFAAGAATFTLREGFLEAEADVAFPEGRAVATISARPFDDRPTYDLAGTLENVDIAALLDIPTAEGEALGLSADFVLVGEGFDPATATVQGSIFGGRGQLFAARVDTIAVVFALDRSVLTLDTLDIRTDAARAQGSGQIALMDAHEYAATDLLLEVNVVDGERLSAYLGQDVRVANGGVLARATGQAGEPIAINAIGDFRRVTYQDFRATSVAIIADGTFDSQEGLVVDGNVRFDGLLMPTTFVQGGDLAFNLADGNLALAGDVVVDNRRDLQIAAIIDLEAEETMVTLETLNLNLDDSNFVLAQPATITFGEAIRVRNLMLSSNGQQILADGFIDLEGNQNFVLTTDNVEIEPFADLFGYRDLGGRLTTTLSLFGSADAPTLSGMVNLEDFASRGVRVGEIMLAVDYADERMNLDARLEHDSGETLTAVGFLPIDLRLNAPPEAAAPSEAVQLDIDAEAFPVDWLLPLMPPNMFTEMGGLLQANVRVRGTQGSPELSGEALLSDGRLGLDVVGKTYENITLPIVFRDNLIVVQDATAYGRTGSLQISGQIALEELSAGEFDLAINADDFEVIDTPTYRRVSITTTQPHLKLTGSLDEPVLRGAFTINRGDVFLTDELMGPDYETVELTEEDIMIVEERFGRRVTAADTERSEFVEALDLDVRIELDRNFWIRNPSTPRFDIEFMGQVDVAKRPFAEEFQLFGQVEPVRGTIEVQGRRFRMEGGQIAFNGPPSEAFVNLRAVLNIPSEIGPGNQAEIFVTFSGRMADNPEIVLDSNPPMDTADIVAYIATGRPAEGFFAGGTGGLGDVAGSFAVGQLGALVETVAGEALGLDAVSIDQEPRGIVLRFGRYVSDCIYVSLSQLIVPSNNEAVRRGEGTAPEILIEYELLRWLQAQMEYRNVGPGAGLLFRYAY